MSDASSRPIDVECVWLSSGINILILGSMIPVINYLFYCYFHFKALYISILVVLSLGSMIGTSSVTCSTPKCRPFKAILFIALGLYGSSSSKKKTSSSLLESLIFRRRPSDSRLSFARLNTNVSDGFHLFMHHGRDIHSRGYCLCSSCSRTLLSR